MDFSKRINYEAFFDDGELNVVDNIEKGLVELPGSYKLWKMLLDYLKKDYFYHHHQLGFVKDKNGEDDENEIESKVVNSEEVKKISKIVNTYERALIFMNKMPRIWLDYCDFLFSLGLLTETRKVYDRALQSLPITQHDRIWEHALNFAKKSGSKQAVMNFYQRYLQYDPSRREDYVEYLLSKSVKRPFEAALELSKVVKDIRFVSLHGKTRVQLYCELCDIICKYPDEMSKHAISQSTLNPEIVIRKGIREFKEESGKLWLMLADYYIRAGEFERARDTYEESLNNVLTVHDFSLVFDAYAQFEDAMISAKLDLMEGDDDKEKEEDDDIDFRLARLEDLLKRKDELLNSLLIRQDPNNVSEWMKRAAIVMKRFNDPERVIKVYHDAIKTIAPAKVKGDATISSLWIEFAKFYETLGDIESAKVIFVKAGEVSYKSWKELVNVYCESIELEIRHGDYETALEKARKYLLPPETQRERAEAEAIKHQLRAKGLSSQDVDQSQIPKSLSFNQQKMLKSNKLWALRLDLEESLSDLDSIRLAYDEAFTLKIVTPQLILNYASLLIERQYFEDAFSVFERGIVLFQWANGARDLYLAYIRSFIDRYAGSKIERTRELFEQAIQCASAGESNKNSNNNNSNPTQMKQKSMNQGLRNSLKPIFLMYANYEEKYSLVSRAMTVYQRACKIIDESEKFDMYLLSIRKARELYGVSKAREEFQTAIETLKDELQVKDICLKYAEMETELGEIQRARALYQYASQFCDPQVVTNFWKEWREFEIAHGNEDTFREMLRISRTVRNDFASRGINVRALASEDILASKVNTNE